VRTTKYIAVSLVLLAVTYFAMFANAAVTFRPCVWPNLCG